MKRVIIISSLIISHLGFSQVTDTGDKVGIGTTTPGEKLHINGNLYMNAGEGFKIFGDSNYFGQYLDGIIFQMEDGNATNGSTDGGFVFRGYTPIDGISRDWMVIKTGGNVGIGTTTPQHSLDIKMDATNFRTFGMGTELTVNTTGGWARALRIRNENNGSVASFGVQNGNAYIATGFDTSTDGTGYQSQKLTVTTDGNVGIGTTTPAATLDIENGDLFIGEEVSANGNRRQMRVYGFDAGGKFYGSVHANYDDNKRTFDISTNNQTHQIKIDASAYATANIILKPGDGGNVGIGTSTPDAKLAVNGNIHTKEVKVDLVGWSDFVFKSNYKLPTLKEVEQHIKDKGHLQDIPSAKEVAKNGFFLGEMDSKLLQKIEELTLYTIQQEKEIEVQNNKIEALERENNELQSLSKRLADIEKLLKAHKE